MWSASGSEAREAIARAGGLVGRAGIAARLSGGISVQRVSLLTRRIDFPEPVVEASREPVWVASEVEAWARANHRGWDRRPAHAGRLGPRVRQ